MSQRCPISKAIAARRIAIVPTSEHCAPFFSLFSHFFLLSLVNYNCGTVFLGRTASTLISVRQSAEIINQDYLGGWLEVALVDQRRKLASQPRRPGSAIKISRLHRVTPVSPVLSISFPST